MRRRCRSRRAGAGRRSSGAGYLRALASGAGTPTFSSISIAPLAAWARFIPRWRRRASAICSPTRIMGLRLVNGSCITSAMPSPRTFCRLRSDRPTSSWPSSLIEPRVIRPGRWSMPMIAKPVCDLPQPDSPTTPRVWPGSRSRETPRRISTGPKETCRSRTSRTATQGIVLRPVPPCPSRRVEPSGGLPEPRAGTRHAPRRLRRRPPARAGTGGRGGTRGQATDRGGPGRAGARLRRRDEPSGGDRPRGGATRRRFGSSPRGARSRRAPGRRVRRAVR